MVIIISEKSKWYIFSHCIYLFFQVSTTSATTKKPKPTKSKTTPAPITTLITTEAPIVEESFTTETPNGDFKHRKHVFTSLDFKLIDIIIFI